MTVSPDKLAVLDEAVRRDLQDVRELFFFWLLVSTAVVAIGVAMEGLEIFQTFREEFSSFRFTPAAKKRILLFSSVGWLLIAIGVAGEGVLDSFVSSADSLLQTFDTTLLTQTRLENSESQ